MFILCHIVRQVGDRGSEVKRTQTMPYVTLIVHCITETQGHSGHTVCEDRIKYAQGAMETQRRGPPSAGYSCPQTQIQVKGE